MSYLRRPGFLGDTNYWFGEVSKKASQQSMLHRKLQEINAANKKNHTPLTTKQRNARIAQHLTNPRRLMDNK